MDHTTNRSADTTDLSDVERYVIVALLATAGTLGILGNSVVILAITLKKKLRSPTNIFVVNLCISDWITCVNIPWVVIAMVNTENEWPLSDWICSLCGFNLIACVGCSTNTLAFIALNRLFMITSFSTIYRRLYTPFKIFLMISLAWLLPMTLATVPLVSEFGDLGYDYKYRTCTWDTTNEHSTAYSLLLAMAYTPIQAGVIVFSYSKIFLHIWSHSKKLHPSSTSDTLSQSGQESRPASRLSDAVPVPSALQEKLFKRQVQVTRNMFYVVCGFMICLVPFGISLMIPTLNSERFVFYAAISLVCSSFINPIIYATKHPEFKDSMLQIVKCDCAQL